MLLNEALTVLYNTNTLGKYLAQLLFLWISGSLFLFSRDSPEGEPKCCGMGTDKEGSPEYTGE